MKQYHHTFRSYCFSYLHRVGTFNTFVKIYSWSLQYTKVFGTSSVSSDGESHEL